MARVSKLPEERRQEIVNTARKLFCGKGFEKTMMADISQELNVAQGLVYRYFKSKTELLYAVVEEFANENSLLISKTIKESEGTAFECLQILLTNKMYPNKNFKEFKELILGIEDNQSMLEYTYIQMMSSIFPILGELIERGNVDGSWNCMYPRESAIFILSGLRGLQTEIPNADLQKHIENILMRILGITIS